MATFRIVPELENLLRPLTPEEYSQLKINLELNGLDEKSLTVADVRGDRILIGGHHRFKICTACRIPITNAHIKVKKLPDLEACAQWIIQDALGQRNLSPDGAKIHREQLRQRILERRQEGESTRAIAEAENVSQSTVQRVLDKAGESGGSPEPKQGTVKGKDGKRHQATKSRRIFCERCQRVGPVVGCPNCYIQTKKTRGQGTRRKTRTFASKNEPPNGAPAFSLKTLAEHIGKAVAEFDKLRRWPNQRTDPRHAAAVRLFDEAYKLGETWFKDALKTKAS